MTRLQRGLAVCLGSETCYLRVKIVEPLEKAGERS